MLFIPGIKRFKKDHNKKIILTGCGRSGTLYMSKVFDVLGFEVGHEGFLADGICSWYIAEKTRAHAVRKMAYGLDTVYIHLVRHPLKVITSMYLCEMIRVRAALDFFSRTRPEYNNFPPKKRCAKYWVEWNKMVEREYPMATLLRIEDFKVKEFAKQYLNVGVSDEQLKKINNLGTDVHTLRSYTKRSLRKAHGDEIFNPVTFDDIGDVKSEVIKLMNKYGYKETEA